MSDVKELQALTKKNSEGLTALTKSVNGIVEKLSKMPADGHPSPHNVFGSPHIRKGEDPLSSRGYSFMKLLGVITGVVSPEEAKVEIGMHKKLDDTFAKQSNFGGPYGYKGNGIAGTNKFLAPMAADFFPDNVVSRDVRMEMKSLVSAGVGGADPDHMNWIKTKQLQQKGYSSKALSWLNELTGGALVAPAEQGEIIELLRNREALVNAGARVVPLPPQGRLKFPRQTLASNTYWVGENGPITQSNIGTGEVTLQAKKLAVLIQAPNELLRFASPAAEALMRDDMAKSLALGLDLAGLEGLGGDTRPLGIINMQNINRIISSSPGANGDKLVGQDIYRFLAAIEESNAEATGFIMRPKSMYKYFQLRADAVAQGDAAGPFLFNLIREGGDSFPPALAGIPVTKSTQVSQSRTKGNQSNLTYVLAGMWEDLLIGMFGAIEFAATTMGDTSFVNDQTWVRGILSADIQARHEAAFCLMDNIDLFAV